MQKIKNLKYVDAPLILPSCPNPKVMAMTLHELKAACDAAITMHLFPGGEIPDEHTWTTRWAADQKRIDAQIKLLQEGLGVGSRDIDGLSNVHQCSSLLLASSIFNSSKEAEPPPQSTIN
jgi:hypothetical protein